MLSEIHRRFRSFLSFTSIIFTYYRVQQCNFLFWNSRHSRCRGHKQDGSGFILWVCLQWFVLPRSVTIMSWNSEEHVLPAYAQIFSDYNLHLHKSLQCRPIGPVLGWVLLCLSTHFLACISSAAIVEALVFFFLNVEDTVSNNSNRMWTCWRNFLSTIWWIKLKGQLVSTGLSNSSTLQGHSCVASSQFGTIWSAQPAPSIWPILIFFFGGGLIYIVYAYCSRTPEDLKANIQTAIHSCWYFVKGHDKHQY